MLHHVVALEEHVLLVGQDQQGRWIVQENHGATEALFASREAALRFALWERHAFTAARVELTPAPLTSILSTQDGEIGK
jgi:hypothetical protein